VRWRAAKRRPRRRGERRQGFLRLFSQKKTVLPPLSQPKDKFVGGRRVKSQLAPKSFSPWKINV